MQTIKEVRSAEAVNAQVEFARTSVVEKIFGLKRGTIYNLHNDGKITGIVLRSRGAKSGCRLWDVASIRKCILGSSIRSLPFGAGGAA